MWTVTELVFWNEQAMYMRGEKVLERPAERLLGARVLELGGDRLGVEAEAVELGRRHGGVLGCGRLVQDSLAAVAVGGGAEPSAAASRVGERCRRRLH